MRMRRLGSSIGIAALALGSLSLAFSRPAFAKKVSLGWKEIKRATEYEIEIKKDGAKTLQKKVDEPSWSGDLPYGVYFYQIRAYDRLKRPGKWTEPKPLVVMPAPPKLTQPEDGGKIVLYDAGAGADFEWKPVKGVNGYEIEIKKDGKTAVKKTVSDSKLHLKGLEAGKYTWTVTIVVKPKDRVPSSYESKEWQSEPSDSRDFAIKRENLGKAEPKAPLGAMQPPSDRKVKFAWEPVEGAKAYEFALFAQADATVPFGPLRALASVSTTDESVVVPVPVDGRYRWQVRALANVDGDKKPEAASQISEAAFVLDKNTDFFEGSGYVAFSTLLTSYDYHLYSPSSNINALAASTALTMRGSGELWFKPQWGVAGAFEGTNFQIEDQTYTRLGYEAVAKYRVNLGSFFTGWSLTPKLGVEERDYIEVFPQGFGQTTFTSSVYGLQAGFDLRKSFGDSFGLGLKVAYFKPLVLSSPNASSLTGDASNRNLSVGLQGIYWLTSHWGAGAGVFIDHRSISYQLSGSSGPAEQVTMDANYLFLSLLYKFGAVPAQALPRAPAGESK
jgi:hypothetical protein